MLQSSFAVTYSFAFLAVACGLSQSDSHGKAAAPYVPEEPTTMPFSPTASTAPLETTYPVVSSPNLESRVEISFSTSLTSAQIAALNPAAKANLDQELAGHFVATVGPQAGFGVNGAINSLTFGDPAEVSIFRSDGRSASWFSMVVTFIFAVSITPQEAIDAAAVYEAAIKGNTAPALVVSIDDSIKALGVFRVVTPAVPDKALEVFRVVTPAVPDTFSPCECIVCSKHSTAKFTSITIQYNSEGADDNGQASYPYGDLTGTFPAAAAITTTRGPAFDATVSDGDLFTVVAAGSTFGALLELALDGGSSGKVAFYTSCSIDLTLGDKFGPFEIVSTSSKNADSRCNAAGRNRRGKGHGKGKHGKHSFSCDDYERHHNRGDEHGKVRKDGKGKGDKSKKGGKSKKSKKSGNYKYLAVKERRVQQLEIVSVVGSCVAFLMGAVLVARKRSEWTVGEADVPAGSAPSSPGANIEGGVVTTPAAGIDRTKEPLCQLSPSSRTKEPLCQLSPSPSVSRKNTTDRPALAEIPSSMA